jgi:hypothetical protein
MPHSRFCSAYGVLVFPTPSKNECWCDCLVGHPEHLQSRPMTVPPSRGDCSGPRVHQPDGHTNIRIGECGERSHTEPSAIRNEGNKPASGMPLRNKQIGNERAKKQRTERTLTRSPAESKTNQNAKQTGSKFVNPPTLKNNFPVDAWI